MRCPATLRDVIAHQGYIFVIGIECVCEVWLAGPRIGLH